MKKFNGFKKGLVYALTTSMVAFAAVGINPMAASAATTGKVNADALNVRSGAGTGYSRVGTVTQGQTVTILQTVQGSDGYTWYKISGSVAGYVRGDYISNVVSDAPARPSSSSGMITADLLNVRTGPGTSYSRIGCVSQGTRLTIISVNGSWYKVTCQIEGDIRTGYVHSDYVQLDGGSNSSGNENNNTNDNTSDSTETVIATGVVNVDALNVRKGASTSESSYGMIYHNAKVEILAQSGSWYKVRCTVNGSSQVGYVYAEYITKTADSNSNNNNNTDNNEQSLGKGIVNVDLLNVRSGAGTSNNRIDQIRKNTEVEILSQVGSWYKVSYTSGGSKKTGYVSAEYITKVNSSTTPSEPETPSTPDTFEEKSGIVNADVLNVRSGAGTNYSKLGTISQNASVKVIGQEGSWYKISCVINGATREGYVSAEFITIVENNNNNSNNNDNNNQDNNNNSSNTDVAGKTGTLTGNGVNFRTGPGTNYNSHGMLSMGTIVNIKGKEGDWYKVTAVINGSLKEGYIYAEWVKVVGSDDSPYEGETDETFEEQIAKFPESYKNALRRLHEKHPTWNFVAQYTGLDFAESVKVQNSGNRSMVYTTSSTPFSWLSTAPGDYDWATDTYYNKDGSMWKGASQDLIAYYMDPRNFLDEQQIFMFETQAYEDSQNKDVVAGILNGTFMADGKGYNANGKWYTYVDTFMEAGEIANVSPYFLASRSRQEVGAVTPGNSVNGTRGVYNFFNIGANASASGNAVTNGLNYASQTGSWRRPWTNQWLAIVGGAEFLAAEYIEDGQNTDYFQKFNVVSKPYYDHQYMGNIQAPCSEASSRYSTYKDYGILNGEFTFIIPVYENMPETAASLPSETGNPNSFIKYLTVDGVNGLSTFSYEKLNYSGVTTSASISISATPVSKYATVISGTGTHNLQPGPNEITVVCQAGNGNKTTYTFNIYRQ